MSTRLTLDEGQRTLEARRITMKKNALVRAVETVEHTKELDPAIAQAQLVVDRAVPSGMVRDTLRGGPLGHPLHPVAILVPAGAWISAAVLDLVPGQSRAARTLVGVGLLGAPVAALSGISDWSELTQRQKRVGIVHWATNLASVALYSASYVQRRRGHLVSGKALGFLALGLIGASGYLGGHLAYRQGASVEVDTADEDDVDSLFE